MQKPPEKIRISVCMAVKDGERFIEEQIRSILDQLQPEDELIISDDASADRTRKIIRSFQDSRILVSMNPHCVGPVKNFENALKRTRGEYIFLADQDDVWMPHKVDKMFAALKENDLVLSDCWITDENLNRQEETFFQRNQSRQGLVKNLLRNSYIGCCMAFHRSVLDKILPFPEKIPMHDQWIGLVAESNFRVRFIAEPLIYYRRHAYSVSSSANRSRHTLWQRLSMRYHLIINLISLIYARRH
jgi:glycosyltransferase involved in cell wall biosynthesis